MSGKGFAAYVMCVTLATGASLWWVNRASAAGGNCNRLTRGNCTGTQDCGCEMSQIIRPLKSTICKSPGGDIKECEDDPTTNVTCYKVAECIEHGECDEGIFYKQGVNPHFTNKSGKQKRPKSGTDC